MEDFVSPYLRLPLRSLHEVRGTAHHSIPERGQYLLGPDEVYVPTPRKDRRIMLACFAAAFLALGYCLGPYAVLLIQSL